MSAWPWPVRAVLEQHFKEAAQGEIRAQLAVGAPVIHRAPAGDSGVARAAHGSVWGMRLQECTRVKPSYSKQSLDTCWKSKQLVSPLLCK